MDPFAVFTTLGGGFVLTSTFVYAVGRSLRSHLDKTTIEPNELDFEFAKLAITNPEEITDKDLEIRKISKEEFLKAVPVRIALYGKENHGKSFMYDKLTGQTSYSGPANHTLYVKYSNYKYDPRIKIADRPGFNSIEMEEPHSMLVNINKEANIVVFITCEWAAEFFKEFSTLHKTLSERQQIHVFVNAKDAKTSVEVGLVQAEFHERFQKRVFGSYNTQQLPNFTSKWIINDNLMDKREVIIYVFGNEPLLTKQFTETLNGFVKNMEALATAAEEESKKTA